MSQQSADSAFPGQNYTCVCSILVLMALHAPLFFRLIWRRFWRRYVSTTWRRLIATCGSWSPNTATTKNSSPQDDLQLLTRVKVICTFAMQFWFVIQNFKKHHFHVELCTVIYIQVCTTVMSHRFWGNATNINQCH